MNSNITNIRFSLLIHLILFLALTLLVVFVSRENVYLWINQRHTSLSDNLFYHITRLPELAYVVFILALGLFTKKKHFLIVAVSLIICTIVILVSKYFLFKDFDRPIVWLMSKGVAFHQVPGISIHSNHSFPSGHTLAAFASLSLAGFFSGKWWAQLLFMFLAILSGYSRIYVSQHYITDVYVGAILGFCIVLITYIILNKKCNSPYWDKGIMNK